MNSNNNNIIQESLRWLRFASDDLGVALHLIRGTRTAPRHPAGSVSKLQKRR